MHTGEVGVAAYPGSLDTGACGNACLVLRLLKILLFLLRDVSSAVKEPSQGRSRNKDGALGQLPSTGCFHLRFTYHIGPRSPGWVLLCRYLNFCTFCRIPRCPSCILGSIRGRLRRSGPQPWETERFKPSISVRAVP